MTDEKPVRSLKEQLDKEAFWVADARKLKRPRLVCIRERCNRYKVVQGAVWCGHYVAGRCQDIVKGVPEDEPLISLSKAKELLDDAAASLEKKARWTEIIDPLGNNYYVSAVTLKDVREVFGAGLNFGKSLSGEEKGSGREVKGMVANEVHKILKDSKHHHGFVPN